MVDRSPERQHSHLRNSIYHAEQPWLNLQIGVEGRREGRPLPERSVLIPYVVIYASFGSDIPGGRGRVADPD